MRLPQRSAVVGSQFEGGELGLRDRAELGRLDRGLGWRIKGSVNQDASQPLPARTQKRNWRNRVRGQRDIRIGPVPDKFC